MNEKKVTVYTQPDCPPCKVVKEFLRHHQIDFEEFDVSKDKAARNRLINVYRSYSTPTIVVGDEVVTGFDLPALEKILGL
ncbi:glutaredoxin-like YruB-family protein [Anoxybacillus calidus]|jgi:glutaredoxin-like YruB-family protein|uniref:Glutaredoxin-like YruB-family protein n=1 Tax=[Anoxybacillus] calidus TaxID=575178 RepID=A0A7V9YY69_9BACL|nr:glutaredoxin domain-containing protein [Anoxybacillus calidus]MBA2870617.1 glutaredoxin-like YruB-family protein [Anoxybacillus calidus]